MAELTVILRMGCAWLHAGSACENCSMLLYAGPLSETAMATFMRDIFKASRHE